MKKRLFILLFTICFFSNIFAQNDVRIGFDYSVPISSINLFEAMGNAGVMIENYNTINENFGICESINFNFIRTNIIYDNAYYGSVFIGPYYKIFYNTLYELSLAGGFKYYLAYGKSSKDFYAKNKNEKITLIDNDFYSAYSFSIEFQCGIAIDEKQSISFGANYSVGRGKNKNTQVPVSNNPDSSYKTLTKEGKFNEFMDVTVCILYCYKF